MHYCAGFYVDTEDLNSGPVMSDKHFTELSPQLHKLLLKETHTSAPSLRAFYPWVQVGAEYDDF